MKEPLEQLIASALTELDELSAVDRIARLTAARELLDKAVWDAMAEASLQGHSLRDIASVASVAPNSVRPALARSTVLGQYANPAGVVDAEGLARARYDHSTNEPGTRLGFTRRKKTT